MGRTTPKIAVLGANGQVGWELQRALLPLGQVFALGRADAPLDDLPRMHAALDAMAPHIVVNAAAYTAVDKAEAEREAAYAINAHAVESLAARCAQTQTLLVHYSTDYVFDGSGEHFRAEDAPTAPLSVYGASKLAGEQALASSGCAYFCFRTSWVYAARGGNFAKTMLRLASERDVLKVVNDQWGAPTGADLIADVTAQVLSSLIKRASRAEFDEKVSDCPGIHSLSRYTKYSNLHGTYHLVADGQTTWHAYAQAVIEAARARGAAIKVPPEAILGIPSSAYPTPAQRPLNSRLSTQKLRDAFGIHLPDWQVGVQRLVAQLVS